MMPGRRRRAQTGEVYYQESEDGRSGEQLRQEDYESHEVWPPPEGEGEEE